MTWWYPIDMGGRTYVVGYSVTMSLIHPFAGLGLDTAGQGGYGGFRCLWAASLRMGGGFGCSAIITFSKFRMGGGFAETAACACTESVPAASSRSRFRSLRSKHGGAGGGGFGCTDSLLVAEAAAFAIGAASKLGLIPPAWAVTAGMVTMGCSGIGVSSSLSNMKAPALV